MTGLKTGFKVRNQAVQQEVAKAEGLADCWEEAWARNSGQKKISRVGMAFILIDVGQAGLFAGKSIGLCTHDRMVTVLPPEPKGASVVQDS
jgi:hypothetical protein